MKSVVLRPERSKGWAYPKTDKPASRSNGRRVRRDDDARRGGARQPEEVRAVESHHRIDSRMLSAHAVQGIEDHARGEAAIRAPLERLVVNSRIHLVELEHPLHPTHDAHGLLRAKAR